jgi:prepilin-type N-terminal cleavage/methylation domain-containing protein
MKTERKIKKEVGFTLLELLVVVAIIAVVGSIVLATETPARTFVNSAAKEIYSAVIDARQEAIRSGRSVIFQTSDRNLVKLYRDENGSNAIDEGDMARTALNMPMRARLVADLGPVYFNNRGYLVDEVGQPATLSIEICETEKNNQDSCVAGGYVTTVTVNVAGVADIVYPH